MIYIQRGTIFLKTTELRSQGFGCLATLVVETGRWNRRGRGRLPMEERLCSCGEIQTEIHVINNCPLSQHFRDEYEFTDISDLMCEKFSNEIVCKIIYNILNLYV